MPRHTHPKESNRNDALHGRAKLITNDGKLHGEVFEISDEGRSGVLVITDDKENTVDKYGGTAAGFQGPGQWRVVT